MAFANSHIRLRNRVVGEYMDLCFTTGFISDTEIGVEREPFGVLCEDDAVALSDINRGRSSQAAGLRSNVVVFRWSMILPAFPASPLALPQSAHPSSRSPVTRATHGRASLDRVSQDRCSGPAPGCRRNWSPQRSGAPPNAGRRMSGRSGC